MRRGALHRQTGRIRHTAKGIRGRRAAVIVGRGSRRVSVGARQVRDTGPGLARTSGLAVVIPRATRRPGSGQSEHDERSPTRACRSGAPGCVAVDLQPHEPRTEQPRHRDALRSRSRTHLLSNRDGRRFCGGEAECWRQFSTSRQTLGTRLFCRPQARRRNRLKHQRGARRCCRISISGVGSAVESDCGEYSKNTLDPPHIRWLPILDGPVSHPTSPHDPE